MNIQLPLLVFFFAVLSGHVPATDDAAPADPALSAGMRASFFECASQSVSNYFVETENLIGQKMVFIASPTNAPVAARCIYDTATHEPRIFLREGWDDVEVAHEITHLRMDLVEGYSVLAWLRNVEHTEAISKAFGRLQTYVKDEVVHARLVKLGLKVDGEVLRPSLFDSVYRNATRYLEEGRDRPADGMAHLDKLGHGQLCRVCFLVQAELVLKNYRDALPPGRIELAERFIRAFRAHRVEESARADIVLELFRTNDVQTTQGQNEILRAWSKLEGFDRFVGLSCYRKNEKAHFTLPFPENKP